MKREWDGMSPREKAMAAALGFTVTVINPLIPVVYGVTYAAYQAKYEAEDEAAEATKEESTK